MKTIPLDLWAYSVHRSLRRHQLEAMAHPPAAELEGVTLESSAEDLAPHRQALDDSAAAVADYLREAGGRGRHLVAVYMGRGRGMDLGLPLVEPGPGLQDLVVVVEHLATRKIGELPVPPPPAVLGHLVKGHPLACPTCGARVWSATPSRATSQVTLEATTRLVEDAGTPHDCPGPD